MSFSPAPRALHEFYAAAHADGAVLCGLGLGVSLQRARERASLWVRSSEHDRETGFPCPSGLAEFGFTPSSIILARPRDPVAALQAALEGARCTALAAVIVEIWGDARAYDLTASRRLALAAKASGVVVLVLRTGASPLPSAADTRWQVRAAPSRPLPARAPGHPVFHLNLLRARNGLEGVQHHLEWDRDARQFIPRSRADAAFTDGRSAHRHETPVSRTVVPISADRPGAPGRWRAAG